MPNLQYRPSRVTPPGASLSDLIEEKGITQKDLSLRLNRSQKHVSQIIRGRAPLTPEFALELERVLGTPAQFWLIREARYQESLSRANQPDPSEADLEWTKSFPYSAMTKLDWVPPAARTAERFHHLLTFFGVVNPEAYEGRFNNLNLQFRRSARSAEKDRMISAWLRRGEIESEGIDAAAYDEKAFARAVEAARALATELPSVFIPRLQSLYAEAGVVLLFVPELPGMGVSGATRWLTPTKALIQITLRYKTTDQLWFTVFHESCHILRHAKRGVRLEITEDVDHEEEEADAFAANLLIPRPKLNEFLKRRSFDKNDIERFACDINVAPGVVVGRLQRERVLDWSSPLNRLKASLAWGE